MGFATALLHSQEYMNQKANIFKPIDKFLYDLEERTSKDIEEVENELHFYTNFLILFICFSIATFVTLFYLNKNQIPNLYYFSSELVNFFKYLNNEMPYNGLIKLNANNEIGQMVKVVNENIERTKEKVEEDRKFIDETINVLNKFEKGDLSQRLETKVKNSSLMKLEEVLNKMAFNLENHIENVLKILNEYSKYNYLNKISTKGITNHLLKLANGINILASSITQMLVENKKNGLVLEKSSKILLENVDKLNTSSNESATSLEETASALEQITSNLRNNTQRIEKMAHYSSAITKSSSNGEELANKTTLAMDEINKQVTLVNQAINVIDQIAFQTNILGLNASVEAVTAGETGKGFAVVAQEVRNLASRSTQAAKEIKDIVHLATTKANEGKDIASDMIEGYRELNKSIKETVELISDIEMSSKEQLLGIEQINIAVNILDKQTQENSSVASKTDIIAKNTNEIAVFIVAEVDKKDFEGKNDFKEDI